MPVNTSTECIKLCMISSEDEVSCGPVNGLETKFWPAFKCLSAPTLTLKVTITLSECLPVWHICQFGETLHVTVPWLFKEYL